MKQCPWCAEPIQDRAIKCRWCRTWLEDMPSEGQAPVDPAPPLEASLLEASVAEPVLEPVVEEPAIAEPVVELPTPVSVGAEWGTGSRETVAFGSGLPESPTGGRGHLVPPRRRRAATRRSRLLLAGVVALLFLIAGALGLVLFDPFASSAPIGSQEVGVASSAPSTDPTPSSSDDAMVPAETTPPSAPGVEPSITDLHPDGAFEETNYFGAWVSEGERGRSFLGIGPDGFDYRLGETASVSGTWSVNMEAGLLILQPDGEPASVALVLLGDGSFGLLFTQGECGSFDPACGELFVLEGD